MKKGLASQLNAWAGTPYEVLFSAPIITDQDGATLGQGAAGAYDVHWVEVARMLVAGGQADATLRLGYEFNLKWPRWSAQSDPAAFASYWRRIVTSMRSVPGTAFRFDWNPALGQRVDLRTYPGDAYVDFVGLDVYDQSYGETQIDPVRRWERYLTAPSSGLLWHRDFAAAHGKAMTYPEWALSTGPHTAGANPDNAYFVRQMARWIQANNVEYALYFDADPRGMSHSLRTGTFPQGAAAFREAFRA